MPVGGVEGVEGVEGEAAEGSLVLLDKLP